MASATGTGRGLRVAVIDSGVHAAHPHVAGGTMDGIGIDAEGARDPEYVDRLGHGTAVAAVIREKAPEAALLVARVFVRELKTTATALVAAIDWAVEQRADLINLSLGTANPDHGDRLRRALAGARARGALVVAAGLQDGVAWLPGSLPGAMAVHVDWTLPREHCVVEDRLAGSGETLRAGERVQPVSEGMPLGEARVRARQLTIRASGYPRPIPGVPPERNLKGISFAVANATGMLARMMSASDTSGA